MIRSFLAVALLSVVVACGSSTGGTGGGSGGGGTGGGSAGGAGGGSGGGAGGGTAGGAGGGADDGGVLLLDYSYGNQITRSYFKVYSSGQIDHRERITAGGMDNPVTEAPLTSTQLTTLQGQVSQARQGTLSVTADAGAALGASVGYLDVAELDGGRKTVRMIEFDTVNPMNLKTTNNTAASTQPLVDFVNAKVMLDMP